MDEYLKSKNPVYVIKGDYIDRSDKSVKIGGDSNAPIITGDHINITNSFNQIRETIDKNDNYSERDKIAIFEKLSELEIAIKKKDKSLAKKVFEFFKDNYKDIIPLILPIVKSIIPV